jgi:hypothetical protein
MHARVTPGIYATVKKGAYAWLKERSIASSWLKPEIEGSKVFVMEVNKDTALIDVDGIPCPIAVLPSLLTPRGET